MLQQVPRAWAYLMIRETLEKQIAVFVEKCNRQIELDSTKFVEEILNEDDILISSQKTWCYYGTWRVTLFVNEYRFGSVLAERLRKISVITHDEYKVFSLSDLEEEITNCVDNFMYDIWNEDIEL